MAEDDKIARLLTQVAARLHPVEIVLRRVSGEVVADLKHVDGSVAWRDYARGPNNLLATLAAEQRYLAEDVGSGCVAGATYADKAAERLRRWQADLSS